MRRLLLREEKQNVASKIVLKRDSVESENFVNMSCWRFEYTPLDENLKWDLQRIISFSTILDWNWYLNEVEDSQLRLGGVHTEHKVQGGVVPVDQFVILSN